MYNLKATEPEHFNQELSIYKSFLDPSTNLYQKDYSRKIIIYRYIVNEKKIKLN